jgi:hypothetical protein
MDNLGKEIATPLKVALLDNFVLQISN